MAIKTRSLIFRALNGSPAENLKKVIELCGGIEKIVGDRDVVLIKPNVQWWNQGAPNLLALKTFVDLVLNRPGGFGGEVVIAENCHRGFDPWNSHMSGWRCRFEWNSDIDGIYNMIDLCSLLKKAHGDRFSTCHWIDVDDGRRRVSNPEDGTGYVYCDGTEGTPLLSVWNGLKGDRYRAVIMTYPIFHTDRGTVVDFKNGVWRNRRHSDQPLKFINFAALNHHGTYCGATSAVKNYLGINDLTGGNNPHAGGKLTNDYQNFHSFAFDKKSPGTKPGLLGAEIAFFMNNIRRADLNITTAEWTGLSSRNDVPVARTRTVLASVDPVALDYHATKYVLYPNSRLSLHDPDNKKGPLHQYLAKCAEEGGGVFNEECVDVRSYDFDRSKFQNKGDLAIIGKKTWGNGVNGIMKFLALRVAKNRVLWPLKLNFRS